MAAISKLETKKPEATKSIDAIAAIADVVFAFKGIRHWVRSLVSPDVLLRC
jgi:hypothetical protein